jgi:hypothetical protein
MPLAVGARGDERVAGYITHPIGRGYRIDVFCAAPLERRHFVVVALISRDYLGGDEAGRLS